MNKSLILYGSIGYTFLINTYDTTKSILIFSDNHAKLPYCKNYKLISEWLEEKTDSDILLEEVPRNNVMLKELFDNSDHTQQLKELFINNPKLISGVDIRPFLIKFSWELLEIVDLPYITLNEYLEEIDKFFNFTNDNIKKLNKYYNKIYICNSRLYIQFKIIRNIYLNYRKRYENYLNDLIFIIYYENITILDEFNNILDNIMEFYVLLNVSICKKNNIIIHCGLLHSEKIIFWLSNLYYYNIIEKKGINNTEELDTIPIKDGCITLP